MAEWKVMRHEALMQISRHVGERWANVYANPVPHVHNFLDLCIPVWPCACKATQNVKLLGLENVLEWLPHALWFAARPC